MGLGDRCCVAKRDGTKMGKDNSTDWQSYGRNFSLPAGALKNPPLPLPAFRLWMEKSAGCLHSWTKSKAVQTDEDLSRLGGIGKG